MLTILHDHGHRRTLVKNPELAFLALLICRVGEYSTIAERPVCVCNHRSDVTRRVGLPLGSGRELDAVEVCPASFVPVDAVALVDGVDGT